MLYLAISASCILTELSRDWPYLSCTELVAKPFFLS